MEIWNTKAPSLESPIMENVSQWLVVVVFPEVSVMGEKLEKKVSEKINKSTRKLRKDHKIPC